MSDFLNNFNYIQLTVIKSLVIFSTISFFSENKSNQVETRIIRSGFFYANNIFRANSYTSYHYY